MKLNVYEQDNSKLQWVTDTPFTLEEMLDQKLKFVGFADEEEEDYEHVGMGYYRKRGH